MRRRLNVRFLAKFFAVVLGVGLSVHILHAVQVRRSADSFLRMADEALEEGKLGDAIHSLGHYLTIRPDDVAARARYALTLERHARTRSDMFRAIAQMERVLAEDEAQQEVRYRLLTNLIQLGQYDKALRHIDTLMPTWPRPAELHYARGGCLAVGFKKHAEAAAAFEKAATLDPHRIDTFELWAAALMQLPVQEEGPEPVQQAREVLDRMVQANDRNFRAYLARARFLHDQGLRKEEKADLDQAVRLAGDEPPVTLALARWQQENANFKAARSLLESGLKKHPRDAALIKSLAALDMQEGRPDEAIKLLRESLSSLPAQEDLAVLLIELLIDRGQGDEAQARLASLRSGGLEPVMADYLKARLAIEKSNWAEALTLLERVRGDLSENSDWQGRTHALLGLCHLQLGDAEQALAAFRRATQKEPGWPQARLGLASALLYSGRTEEALSHLNDLVAQQKAETPLAGLGYLHARALLAQTLRRPERERDWTAFAQALARLRKSEPTNRELPLLEAEMLAAKKQFVEAEAVIGKARTDHPKVLAYWTFAADLAARQNHPAIAVRLLDDAEKLLGDSLELRLARLRQWERSGGPEADARITAFLHGTAAWDIPRRARFLRELADAAARLGEERHAEKIWQQLAELEPRDIRSRAHLLEAALARNQLTQARTLITQLRDLEGERGMWWRYGAVSILIREGQTQSTKLAEAKTLLDRLALQHRDWARVPLLRARLEEAHGDLASALTFYQDAIRLGDRDPRRIRNVIADLAARKRFQEADDVLVLLEEQGALPPDLMRQGAEIALLLPDPAKARQRAMQPALLESNDYRTQLWLVRVYHALGDDGPAEALARKALAQHAETPDTWISLVRQLTLNGKREEARTLLEQCRKALPSTVVPSTRGRCLEILGDLDAAEAAFLKGWKEQPGDFIHAIQATELLQRIDRLPRAVPVLVSLLQPGAATPRELLPPLRRRLALTLVEADPAQKSKALALLDLNGKAGAESGSNQRARALVLLSDPGSRSEAIKLFKDAARRSAPGDDEQYLLARQFFQTGDLLAAGDVLEPLALYQRENPQILALYVQVLVAQGRVGEAQSLLNRLQRLEPTSPRTRQAQDAVKQSA